MTHDDKPKGSKKRDLRSIELVEKLYKLADELHGGFAEPEPPSLLKPVATNMTTDAGDDAQADISHSRDENENPFWILMVLEDLIGFAEHHGYSDLETCLRDAHHRVATILSDTDSL